MQSLLETKTEPESKMTMMFCTRRKMKWCIVRLLIVGIAITLFQLYLSLNNITYKDLFTQITNYKDSKNKDGSSKLSDHVYSNYLSKRKHIKLEQDAHKTDEGQDIDEDLLNFKGEYLGRRVRPNKEFSGSEEHVKPRNGRKKKKQKQQKAYREYHNYPNQEIHEEAMHRQHQLGLQHGFDDHPHDLQPGEIGNHPALHPDAQNHQIIPPEVVIHYDDTHVDVPLHDPHNEPVHHQIPPPPKNNPPPQPHHVQPPLPHAPPAIKAPPPNAPPVHAKLNFQQKPEVHKPLDLPHPQINDTANKPQMKQQATGELLKDVIEEKQLQNVMKVHPKLLANKQVDKNMQLQKEASDIPKKQPPVATKVDENEAALEVHYNVKPQPRSDKKMYRKQGQPPEHEHDLSGTDADDEGLLSPHLTKLGGAHFTPLLDTKTHMLALSHMPDSSKDMIVVLFMPMFTILPDHISINRSSSISYGSSGIVRKASFKDMPVLVKNYQTTDTKIAPTEVYMHHLMSHIPGVPAVFGFVGQGASHNEQFIVMQHVTNLDGSRAAPILEFVKKAHFNDQFTLMEICLELAKIVQRIHELNIVHTKIFPENIVVATEFHNALKPHLIDYAGAIFAPEAKAGKAVLKAEDRANLLKNRKIAPEVQVDGVAVSASSDAYSLGYIFEEVLKTTAHTFDYKYLRQAAEMLLKPYKERSHLVDVIELLSHNIPQSIIVSHDR